MITHKINLKLPIHHWCKTLNQSCGKSFVQNNKLWTEKLATLKYQIRSAIRRKIFSDKQHDFFKNWFIPRIVFHDFQILPFVDLHSESHPKAMNAKNKKVLLRCCRIISQSCESEKVCFEPQRNASPPPVPILLFISLVWRKNVSLSPMMDVSFIVLVVVICEGSYGNSIHYRIKFCVCFIDFKKFLRNVILTDSRREML